MAAVSVALRLRGDRGARLPTVLERICFGLNERVFADVSVRHPIAVEEYAVVVSEGSCGWVQGVL
jgi:hypothetical protein